MNAPDLPPPPFKHSKLESLKGTRDFTPSNVRIIQTLEKVQKRRAASAVEERSFHLYGGGGRRELLDGDLLARATLRVPPFRGVSAVVFDHGSRKCGGQLIRRHASGQALLNE